MPLSGSLSSPESKGVRMNYSSFWVPSTSSDPVLFCPFTISEGRAKKPLGTASRRVYRKYIFQRLELEQVKHGVNMGMVQEWQKVLFLVPPHPLACLWGRSAVRTGLSSEQRQQQRRESEEKFLNPARSHLNVNVYVSVMSFWKIMVYGLMSVLLWIPYADGMVSFSVYRVSNLFPSTNLEGFSKLHFRHKK